MPYSVKGKCVYKKGTGKKVGCTDGNVDDYLAALHTHANEADDSEEETLEEKKLVRFTKRQLRRIIEEAMILDIEPGDVILTGRFKNKRTIVKTVSFDEYGHPTVNGRSILKFKIEKLLPREKWSRKSRTARRR
jgi:hypothetical protein